MRGKITKEAVDDLKPVAKRTFMWDTEVKGFGIRVSPNGRKVYVCQYRAAGGGRRAPTRRVTIGAHGALTPSEARKRARSILGEVADDHDPAAELAARRKAHTIAELADEYVTACEKGLVLTRRGKPKAKWTILMDKGRIAAHIKPLIGSTRVIDLKTKDVITFMNDVIMGKTAMARAEGARGSDITGGPGAAAVSVATLGAMLTYAIELGYRADNPTRAAKTPVAKVRTRRLTADEYERLGKALSAADVPIPSVAAAAVRFLALSGWRKQEAAELTIPSDNFAGSSVVLEHTKTGRSVRPLGRDAVEVARASIAEFRSNSSVFPGRGGAIKSLQKPIRNLFKAANIQGASAHTLRHSFGSEAADLGYAESTIAGLLGHRIAGTTGKYIHRADATLVAAANHIAGHIAAMMRGEAKPAEVIDLAAAQQRRMRS